MLRVHNFNRNGEPISDLSKHIVKHDEFPEIWSQVQRIKERMKRDAENP